MNIICLILARKNSKRIINKNLINFKGKPLIYWSLKQSLRLKNIDKVIISSDSNEIINFVKKVSNKFVINKRPKYLSKDKTTSEATIKYLIKKYKIKENTYILLLQPTSPLRKIDDVKKIINFTRKYKTNSIHSVSVYKGKKILRKKIISINKKINKNHNLSINGSIYFFKTELLVKKNSIYEKPQFVYITAKKNSLDIDNYSDLKK